MYFYLPNDLSADLRKSTNGGTNWTVSSLPYLNTHYEIEVHPSEPGLIFISGLGGIIMSDDYGASWTQILSSLGNAGRATIAIDPTNTDYLYAMYNYASAPHNDIFKRYDITSGWDASFGHTQNIKGAGEEHYMELHISTNGEIYVGGYDLKYFDSSTSTFIDKSSTINLSNNYMHPDVRQIFTIDNSGSDIVFIAHDGGVSRSYNISAGSPNITDMNQSYSDLCAH